MSALVCEKCEAIVSGETTVGLLIKEGDILQREGIHLGAEKWMKAMAKYDEAWKALKSNGGHAECINIVDDEYKKVYRTIQGSRA